MAISFLQLHKEFKGLAPVSLSSYCIYGGAAYEPQESAMQLGIDILVGTPGRILDHVTRGSLDLSELRSVSGRGSVCCRVCVKEIMFEALSHS